MKIKIFLLSLVLLSFSTTSHAIPIVLELTLDEPLAGLGILSGDLEDTFIAFEANTPQTIDIEKTGINWYVRSTIFRGIANLGGANQATYYDIAFAGRHITNPPPHVGEVSPGLFLGNSLEVYHSDVSGITQFGPGAQDDAQTLIHPGGLEHFDTLKGHIDDLNGAVKGYTTADNQVSGRAILTHSETPNVPEPASVLLLGSGLLGLGMTRRKRA